MDNQTEWYIPGSISFYLNNIRLSFISNAEVYINNQQTRNSNRPSANKFYIPNNSKGATSEDKEVWDCELYDYADCLDEKMGACLFETFLTRRKKLLRKPDGFVLHGEGGLRFSPFLKEYKGNMKLVLKVIRAGLNYCKISDIWNFSLRIVDCSLQTGDKLIITGKQEEKCLHMLQWSSAVWKLRQRPSPFLGSKTSSFKNYFYEDLVFCIDIEMNTISAFTASYIESSFWYQQPNMG